MSSLPSIEDLMLVAAVVRHGSVGAAARELLISQPAASGRLAALERRVGERLFDRDTTGARATSAGRALCDQAVHVLAHLENIIERTRAAAHSTTIGIGTFGSLAALLFPALQQLLPEVTIDQATDHGDRLIDLVGESSLDAAFVAIASQMRLPAGVAATPIGADRLSLFSPAGVPGLTGRRPLKGREVIAYTYDLSNEALHRNLADRGARPLTAATAETAIRMARSKNCLAVLPRGLARHYATDSETVSVAPVPGKITLFMVTRRPAPESLSALVGRLHTFLGMQSVSAEVSPVDTIVDGDGGHPVQ